MRRILLIIAAALSVGSSAEALNYSPTSLDLKNARSEQREELDLRAQQDMADWAFWMLVVTVIGVAVSGLAFLALLQSFAQTRRALTDGFLERRPWLTVTDVTFTTSVLGNFHEHGPGSQVFVPDASGGILHLLGDFTVENTGNSPAFSIAQNCVFKNPNTLEQTEVSDPSPLYSGILTSGSSEKVTIVEFIPVPEPDYLGNIQCTVSIEYRHFGHKEILRTVIEFTLHEAHPEGVTARNYMRNPLTRTRFVSEDFRGVVISPGRIQTLT